MYIKVVIIYIFAVVAFLVAQHQNKQLIGSYGILPASSFLDDVRRRTGGREGTIKWSTFLQVPSLLWLFDYGEVLDELLDYIAYAGLGLSTFLIINGGANWFIMFALWALYHSLVNVGQRWYGFGRLLFVSTVLLGINLIYK
jgi:hypothetical protein